MKDTAPVSNAAGVPSYRRASLVAAALAAASLLPVPAFAQNVAGSKAAAPIVVASATLPGAQPHALRPLTPVAEPPSVSLNFVSADITDVLKALSLETKTNIVSGPEVTGKVTVSLANVTLNQALEMISHISGFQYAQIGNTYVVGSQATLDSFQTASNESPTVTRVISFNYSDPNQLTTIISNQYPNVKVTVDKTTGVGSTGGILLVTGQQSDVDSVQSIIDQSEAALSKNVADSTTVVYDIKYDSADDLQTVLARLVPNLIVTPGPSLRQPPVAPSTADAGGATSTTTSYGASAPGTVVTSITGNLPTKPTTDSLLLTGSAADIAQAQTILNEIDLRPQEIDFQAKVADINDTLYNQLGLTYSFAGATTTIGQVTGAGAIPQTTQFRTNLPIGYTPLSQFVNVGLQAAENNNEARLLASPNISAIDGQPAAIFIGNDITYVSSITASTTGQNITTATVSAGIKLFITGKVDNDGYITVNLHPEVSSVSFTASAGGAQLPNIATTEATTTLRVRNGDIIALGGLAENSKTKTMNGVPFLDRIPILGSLFRSNTYQYEHRQLVIFIKVAIDQDGNLTANPAPPPTVTQ